MIQQWDFPVDKPISLPAWRGLRVADDIDVIAGRRRAGDGLRTISAAYGVGHETIRWELARAGIRTARETARVSMVTERRPREHRQPGQERRVTLSSEEIGVLLARHRVGKSIRSLARDAGVSHETVRRAFALEVRTRTASA